MAAVYDQDGVRFMYPENWELSAGPADDLPREVSVQSPVGGFWSLLVYPADADPSELADEAKQALEQEYEGLEAEAAREQIGAIQAIGYDLDFYCLDLLVSARTRGFRSGEHTFLVLSQAESRDFAALNDVFRAITLSLLGTGRPRPDE